MVVGEGRVVVGGFRHMLYMLTKPFAQPTAMSLLESQLRHVHTVLGGRASKAGVSNFTVAFPCQGCGCEE